MTVIASSGGLIVALLFIVIIVGVAFGIFSRQGSEIDDHPLGGERGDGAPGAERPSDVEGSDTESSAFDQHGTR